MKGVFPMMSLDGIILAMELPFLFLLYLLLRSR